MQTNGPWLLFVISSLSDFIVPFAATSSNQRCVPVTDWRLTASLVSPTAETLWTSWTQLIRDTDSRISGHVRHIRRHDLHLHPHHVMMDMNKATIEKGYAVMTWGHETRAQRQKAQTISLWIIHLIAPLILPDIFLLTFLSLITSSSLHKDAQHRVSGERTQGELRVVTQARVSKHGRLIRDRLGVIMVNEWPYVTPSALSSVSVRSVHRDVNLGSFSTFAEFIRLVRKLQEETSKLTLKNLVHHSVSRQKWCIQAQTESASWRPVGWIKLKRPNICDCFPCTGCGELLQNSVAFICPAARLIRLEGGQRGLMGCFLFPTCSQRCGFYPLSSLCYWTKSL